MALQAARGAITRPLEGDVWRRDAEDPSLAGLRLRPVVPAHAAQRRSGSASDRLGVRPRAASGTFGQPVPRRHHSTAALPGRRKELGALEGELGTGKRRRLLITGPGGQGKTALAGKLAQTLRDAGWEILAWSARPENPWQDFRFELELLFNTKRYDRMERRCQDETCRARLLLRLLRAQFGNRVSYSSTTWNPSNGPTPWRSTLASAGATLSAWITAAQGLCDQGLVLLVTSHWCLPDWPEADH